MAKKLLAILLTMIFVLSFAACGTKGGDETTAAPDESETTGESVSEEITEDATEAASEDTTAEESSEETEDTTKADETEASSEKESEKTSEKTSEKASEKESEESTEAAKAPSTKAEIVEYFNTSVNKVKKDAKSATKNYSKINLAGSTQLPGWVNSVARVVGGADKFIDDQLTKNSQTSPETYTGADIKAKFPVEGESYASKLTPADVSSATCTEKNGKYTITITTVKDATSQNVSHGSGHAPKAFNVPLPATINDNVPGFAKNMIGGTAAMEYPASTVKVVIDAKTGNVESAVYDLYWTIHFGTDTTLPFHTQDSWTIKY